MARRAERRAARGFLDDPVVTPWQPEGEERAAARRGVERAARAARRGVERAAAWSEVKGLILRHGNAGPETLKLLRRCRDRTAVDRVLLQLPCCRAVPLKTINDAATMRNSLNSQCERAAFLAGGDRFSRLYGAGGRVYAPRRAPRAGRPEE